MLLLHAFHGVCGGSSGGGRSGVFNSRSELRNAFIGAGFAGRSLVRSTFSTRALLSEISLAMSGASGRFFQYFSGISDCIARTLSRAGLKMLR
ncbi:MAG: hypothetical protein U1F61_31060 [Opitutaceae bacterium]